MYHIFTCHNNTALLLCAQFHSDHFATTWMRAEWNYHRFWITMEKSFVKWAPGQRTRNIIFIPQTLERWTLSAEFSQRIGKAISNNRSILKKMHFRYLCTNIWKALKRQNFTHGDNKVLCKSFTSVSSKLIKILPDNSTGRVKLPGTGSGNCLVLGKKSHCL